MSDLNPSRRQLGFWGFAARCARDSAIRWHRQVWIKGYVWRRRIGFDVGFSLWQLALDAVWWTRLEARSFARRMVRGQYW